MDEQKDEKQKMQEPHVQVFGADIKGGGDNKNKDNRQKHSESYKMRDDCYSGRQCCCSHHHHHGSGIFGLGVILAGILLLLNNIGTVSWEVWNFIWPFWPAFLLLVGLRIIFGHNWGADGLIFLVALALYAFIVVFALVRVDSFLVANLPTEVINFMNNFKLINPSI